MIDRAAHAVADPTRRAILSMVEAEERTAGSIASSFDVSRPAISQHLGVLRDAGLVTIRQAGRQRFYRARPEGLQSLRAWLESFWTGALDQLQLVAEAEQARRDSA